jgi:molecular chaperone GrpE
MSNDKAQNLNDKTINNEIKNEKLKESLVNNNINNNNDYSNFDENETKDQTENLQNDKIEKKNIKEVEKQTQIDELTNLLKRVQAEFSNYMNRTEQEKKLYVKNASKNLMLKMLPILDNFDLALKNTSNYEEFLKGIKMIYSQMISTLETEGLNYIDKLEKFDPKLHEAVSVEETDKEDNVILEELRKGYMLNDVVLRHSLVKVSKKKDKND